MFLSIYNLSSVPVGAGSVRPPGMRVFPLYYTRHALLCHKFIQKTRGTQEYENIILLVMAFYVKIPYPGSSQAAQLWKAYKHPLYQYEK